MRTASLVLVALASAVAANAQDYWGFGVHFDRFTRSGRWSEIHGDAFAAGARASFGRGGLVLAAEGSVLFGNEVRTDPLAALRTPEGVLLGDVATSAQEAFVDLKSRGWRGALLAGYRYTPGQSSVELRALLGPSYSVSFIRIQDDAELTTSNLRDDYKRGYDRRTGGVGLLGELAAAYWTPERTLLVYLAGTLHLARAKSLNSTQFDLQAQSPASGTDLGLGARVGLVVPLRVDAASRADETYY